MLSGYFIKRNLANGSFNLVNCDNLTKAVYMLSTYTPLCRNLSKVDFLKEVHLIFENKSTALFLKLII